MIQNKKLYTNLGQLLMFTFLILFLTNCSDEMDILEIEPEIELENVQEDEFKDYLIFEAFAGPTEGSNAGYCFSNDGFNVNGWVFRNFDKNTVENESWTYPIWADAENCSTSEGEIVGHVSFSSIPGTNKLSIKYTADKLYGFVATNIYLGEELYPTKGGKLTVDISSFSEGKILEMVATDEYIVDISSFEYFNMIFQAELVLL